MDRRLAADGPAAGRGWTGACVQGEDADAPAHLRLDLGDRARRTARDLGEARRGARGRQRAEAGEEEMPSGPSSDHRRTERSHTAVRSGKGAIWPAHRGVVRSKLV